jgi:hypothetical protein
MGGIQFWMLAIQSDSLAQLCEITRVVPGNCWYFPLLLLFLFPAPPTVLLLLPPRIYAYSLLTIYVLVLMLLLFGETNERTIFWESNPRPRLIVGTI